MINNCKKVRARKEHCCCLCGSQIKQKEEYYSEEWPPWTMVEDKSSWYSYKAHNDCHWFMVDDLDYWNDSETGFSPPYETGEHHIFIERMSSKNNN